MEIHTISRLLFSKKAITGQAAAQLESRRVLVRGLSMHYRFVEGMTKSNSTAIVLVHGLVVSSRYMIPTAQQLAKYYQVYIPDLPGFGKSASPGNVLDIAELADALSDWMEAIGLERAILLGNSIGCQIITQFAQRHSERLQMAILVAPTMDPHAPTMRQEILRWLVNLPCEPVSLYPIVMRDFLDIGVRRFVLTFRYSLRDHMEEHLPYMHIPTLVVRGGRDTVVPQRWAEEVTQLLPHGKLVVIDKAAHDVNYNSPVQLTDVVRTFIENASEQTFDKDRDEAIP